MVWQIISQSDPFWEEIRHALKLTPNAVEKQESNHKWGSVSRQYFRVMTRMNRHVYIRSKVANVNNTQVLQVGENDAGDILTICCLRIVQ